MRKIEVRAHFSNEDGGEVGECDPKVVGTVAIGAQMIAMTGST